MAAAGTFVDLDFIFPVAHKFFPSFLFFSHPFYPLRFFPHFCPARSRMKHVEVNKTGELIKAGFRKVVRSVRVQSVYPA